DPAAGVRTCAVERTGDRPGPAVAHGTGPQLIHGTGQVLHQPPRLRPGERGGDRGDPSRERDLLPGAAALMAGRHTPGGVIAPDALLGGDLPGRIDRGEG